MFNTLSEMISYGFLRRALLVGVLVALCCALLGVSLVLKRYSMIGDGLSHVGFGAISVALAMNAAPLAVTLPVVILAAFFLLRISSDSSINGDAAIAVISSSALAFGLIVTSLSSGSNADAQSYLFGSVLAMSSADVLLSVVMSVVVLVLYLGCYHRMFAVTFDEPFARATGIPVGVYHTLLALLTAVTVVVGMRLMGALLISSLVIFPALTSMRVCRSFLGVTVCSAVVSVVCFVCGLVLSYIYNTPAGASVVGVNFAAFVIAFIVGRATHRTD
jgi:ABC-type Mn2+/Zn2+ transport system permease subunit